MSRERELGFAVELVKIHGGIAYVAGHPPIDGSTILVEGVVGRDGDVS